MSLLSSINSEQITTLNQPELFVELKHEIKQCSNEQSIAIMQLHKINKFYIQHSNLVKSSSHDNNKI